MADWYLAATRTLNDLGNSDRFAHAAQSIREVMEKFPECAGRDVIDLAGNAADIVRGIKQKLDRLPGVSPAAAADWNGEIDGELRTVLVEIRTMVDGFVAAGVPRAEQMKEVFRELMPGGNAISAIHVDENVQAWIALRRYFNNVAHHRVTEVDEGEFRTKIISFEQLAGAQLAPAPTDDMEALDQLIQEAERAN